MHTRHDGFYWLILLQLMTATSEALEDRMWEMYRASGAVKGSVS